jgi:hypothetical protein
VPKRGFITIVLVGASVDRADHWEENRKIMRQFLDQGHPGLRPGILLEKGSNFVQETPG